MPKLSAITVIGGVRPRAASRSAAFFRSMNIWFWAIVGLPTLLAGVYFFGIASDLYLSEVKFLVRGPAKPQMSGFSAMLSSAAASSVSEDTYAVHEYLMSRDAVRRLEREDDLRALLSRPEGDLISRFPGVWFWRNDFEALHRAYGRFVTIEIDSERRQHNAGQGLPTGGCAAVADSLLRVSEQLVNTLNERARHDALAVFQTEVDNTEQQIARDPGPADRLPRQGEDARSEERRHRADRAVGPDERPAGERQVATRGSPQKFAEQSANPTRAHPIGSLEKLIAEERAKITGDSNSVATALGEYERLDVQHLLAEKQLASAFTSLEAARLEAQRQQLYLETIAKPNLADYPLYPEADRLVRDGRRHLSAGLRHRLLWLPACANTPRRDGRVAVPTTPSPLRHDRRRRDRQGLSLGDRARPPPGIERYRIHGRAPARSWRCSAGMAPASRH